MNQPDLVHNPGMAERSLSSGEFHGRLASVWERKYDVRLSFKARERILVEAILRHCRPGSHWVDAGCGTGRFSRRLAACGAGRRAEVIEHVTGHDTVSDTDSGVYGLWDRLRVFISGDFRFFS